MNERYLMAIDIGGTFTDLVLLDAGSGDLQCVKRLSTPKDFASAVIDGIQQLQQRTNMEGQQIRYVVHGCTVGINAIIQRNGVKTGVITTEGFRDLLVIGRQARPKIYKWEVGRARPLVPRQRVHEVPERVIYTGEVLRPLEEKKAREILKVLKKQEVKAVAVCLLHSYVNNGHEQKLKKLIEEELPGVYTSISSELIPEFREYERLSTTLMNAYIGPLVSKYITTMEELLAKQGIKSLLIMSSSGGMSTTEVTKQFPINSVESGPAAGVIAANHLGKLIGQENIISFDMGGTTAKASLIYGGELRITGDYEVSPLELGEHIIRGTGYPLKTPVIDMIEVGAGGGSIAWIDKGGALRVGPHSAGADPGPACYTSGGTEPTVTDANVVLNRINAEFFLGGEMHIDAQAAYRAIHEKIAKPLMLSVEEAAQGMLDVSNATMARSIRYVSVERGYDVQAFTLVAFGGAAPTQICALADTVGIPEIVVPTIPGLFSALGMLMADLRHDYVQTYVISGEELEAALLNEQYETLERQGIAQLQNEGVVPEDMKFLRAADIRYERQSYELTVPVPGGILQDRDIPRLLKTFHTRHERVYGFSMPAEKTMLINIRLTAIGVKTKPKLNARAKRSKCPDPALKTTRKVYFAEPEGWVSCAIYARNKLVPGNVIAGPAVIEEADSTVVVFPDYEALIDEYGNVILRK